MKKLGIILSLLLVSLLFSGCDFGGKMSERQEVYVSSYPMYDFTKKIGGDKVVVINLIPAGAEPHDWEPSAKDISALERAAVFIYSGVGLEHWVDKVLGALNNKELVVVEASKGLALLEGTHQHEHHHHYHGENDEHEEPTNHEEHGEEGSKDPHVWLNPQNAKHQMKAIKDALAKVDPDNADYYEENYKKYAAELDKLDAEYKEGLKPFTHREIIVSHQAFGYLCEAYGLTQESIRGISPEEEPSPARMGEIIRFAKTHQVKVIFFEEGVDSKISETIAREIGAEVDVLNPLESLSLEAINAGEDYFSVMRKNLKAIQGALMR